MRNGFCLLTGIVLAFCATLLQAAEDVSHPQTGLRLLVPEGFSQDPDRIKGNVIFAFLRPAGGDQKMETLVLIRRLEGVISREKMGKKFAERFPIADTTTEEWKGLDLEVFRVYEREADTRVVGYVTLLPLKPNAVQVEVMGEAGREEELKNLLKSVLGSLDGKSNWLTPEQRVNNLIVSGIQFAVIVGAIVMVVVGVRRWVRRREESSAGAGKRTR